MYMDKQVREEMMRLLSLILVTKKVVFIRRSKMLEIFVISLEDPFIVSHLNFACILYIKQEVPMAMAQEKIVIITVSISRYKTTDGQKGMHLTMVDEDELALKGRFVDAEGELS